MEVDQPISGRTISADLLYTSIESTNWLLDHGIATVGKNHVVFEKWSRHFKHIHVWLTCNSAKALALPHVQRRSLNGLASSLQLKIKMFLGTVDFSFSKCASTESREKIYRNQTKEKMAITNGQFPRKYRKGQCLKCGISICWEHSMRIVHGCLQWIFILYFIFIVLSFLFML